MNHTISFPDEVKFHEALKYMLKQNSRFNTKQLKHILKIFNPQLVNRLFTRKKCRRSLTYIGESNEHFKHGSHYQSITFNGASYEVIEMNGEVQIIGSAYFE